jgi:hypothetical protein
VGERSACLLPPSQKGYGCFLGFAIGFSPTERGGGATSVGADIAGGGKEERAERVEISGTSPTPFSLVHAHISRIFYILIILRPRLIPDLSHWPEDLSLPSKSPIFFLDIDDTILPVISPRHVTNFR